MVDFPIRICCTMQCSNQGTRPHCQHLVRCQPHHGRCPHLKRRVSSKTMVSRRTQSQISHKCVRTESCKRGIEPGSTRGYCQDQFRFKNCSSIYQEARGNKKFTFEQRGMSSLERSACKEADSCVSPLVVNQRQCDDRLSVPKSVTSVGVRVIQRNLSTGPGPLPHQTNTGHLRLQEHKEAPQVHVLVPRSTGSGKGCNVASLGQGVICFSSSSSCTESSSENRKGKDQGCNDLAKVAVSPVVAPCPESSVGSDPAPPQLQDCPVNGGQVQGPALHGPSGGSSSPEQDLNDFLSNHLATGTQKGYNSSFSKFKTYCLSKNLSPTSCNPEEIAKYIQFLYTSGSKYSTVNLARSAISKYHDGFNGTPAGQHKMVCNAVKAVFRLRPPLPKYKTTYDVSIVLDYIKSLPTNSELSLKMLSYKALFLITIATISRVSSIAKLGPTLSVLKVSLFLIN